MRSTNLVFPHFDQIGKLSLFISVNIVVKEAEHTGLCLADACIPARTLPPFHVIVCDDVRF
jgi:hypothetical protein